MPKAGECRCAVVQFMDRLIAASRACLPAGQPCCRTIFSSESWSTTGVYSRACLRAHQSVDEENKPGFVASSKAVIKHTVFLPLLTYKATILLSLQFFVAMLQPRLAEDGRNQTIARDMVIIFNIFSAVLGLVVGLPVFGRILDRGDTITVSRCATLLAVLYNCLLASSAVWNPHADVASMAWGAGNLISTQAERRPGLASAL